MDNHGLAVHEGSEPMWRGTLRVEALYCCRSRLRPRRPVPVDNVPLDRSSVAELETTPLILSTGSCANDRDVRGRGFCAISAIGFRDSNLVRKVDMSSYTKTEPSLSVSDR
jgi:hypothetical protein